MRASRSRGRAFLHDSLRLLTDAHHSFARSHDADRRLANQAFYTRLDITTTSNYACDWPSRSPPIGREALEHGDDEGEGAAHQHDPTSHVAGSRQTLRGAGENRTPVHQPVSGLATTIPDAVSNAETLAGQLPEGNVRSFPKGSGLSHRQRSFPPSSLTSVAGL